MNYFKAFLLGVIQGITEWLPISSTGHMLIFEALLPLDVSPEFRSLFMVIIQLFSVLAVLVLYRERLIPRQREKREARKQRRLYLHVLLAALPAALAGFLLDDMIERFCSGYEVICFTLIFYGILFFIVEKYAKTEYYYSAEEIDGKAALKIGCFQALALIPGTSRSGATVIGGKMAHCSRSAATEFSFFLAIPTMLGASLLRLLKYAVGGSTPSGEEALLLLVGGVTAFLVSLLCMRFLIGFVREHSFRIFGWYRILFGIFVFILFRM